MKRRGFALAMVLLVIPVAALLLSTLVTLCASESRYVLQSQRKLQAFYLAQSGLNLAYQGLAASNFSQVQASYPGLSFDAARNTYRWSQDSSWLEFSVSFPGAGKWVIDASGGVGTAVSRQRQEGTTEGIFNYAIFDAQDLSEFVRGADQTITGRIHANGNLYLRPTGARLTIRTDSMTSGGRIIRFRDAWGRPDEGGTVEISKDNASGTLVAMAGGTQGTALDSYHANWTSQAPARWGTVVKDSALGAGLRNAPTLESLEPGGYYDQRAGLRITQTSANTTWLSTKTFTNQAEGNLVTVRELNLEALSQAGQFPANGLIYSSAPLRLVNASKLGGPLTVVVRQNLYVQGDFNQVYPSAADVSSQTSRKQSAALISGGRIYHLSTSFKDANSSGSSIPTASEPSRFAGDPANVLEINAALVDATPTVDERNFRRDYAGVTNPFYDPVVRSGQNAWQNSDDFLEGLASVTVKKRGSVVHLQNARMAPFDNSGSLTRWVVKTFYAAPKRDYGYDPDLGTKPPPFTPVVSKRGLWTCLQ